ncbi:MAG: ParB N-terminal domain-containing protein [Proteobacteria bacterium]|nr:ParB N-terminal domain-containing protein [Pseudomonadota bacterium]
METNKKVLRTEGIGVKNVPTTSLKANPHNPRMLFDRKPLNVLKESIRRVGILVPLTVYKESKTGQLIILDGQRRWICAQDLNLKEVPVNEVAEPSLTQNIVTMFQIHKLRQDWELMPTALKLEVLIRELKETNPARLAELTGLDQAVVIRCKKLLYFPKRYQDMMLDPDQDKRIKADFFIELYPIITDRDVKKMPWFQQSTFIDQMLSKYLVSPKTIKSVTDFRLIKQHITNARTAKQLGKLSNKLQRFCEEREAPISILEVSEAKVHTAAKKLVKTISRIHADIESLDVDSYYGEKDLWDALSELLQLLQKKLSQADRRI